MDTAPHAGSQSQTGPAAPVGKSDSREALLTLLPILLDEVAALSADMAETVGPLLRNAPEGHDRTTALRGLQLQDEIYQRLQRIADAARLVARDRQADLAEALKLDQLVQHLEAFEGEVLPQKPDIELF